MTAAAPSLELLLELCADWRNSALYLGYDQDGRMAYNACADELEKAADTLRAALQADPVAVAPLMRAADEIEAGHPWITSAAASAIIRKHAANYTTPPPTALQAGPDRVDVALMTATIDSLRTRLASCETALETAYAESSALQADDRGAVDDYRIPVEVTVHPGTKFGRGCKLSTVIACIRSRTLPDPCPDADHEALKAMLPVTAAPAAVTPGFVLVPVEANGAMVEAAQYARMNCRGDSLDVIEAQYEAMIAAAPKSQPTDEAPAKGSAMDDIPARDEDALHAMNAALCAFAQRWRMNGDYLHCEGCGRPIIASHPGALLHADFCKLMTADVQNPWLTLAELLRPITPPRTEQTP